LVSEQTEVQVSFQQPHKTQNRELIGAAKQAALEQWAEGRGARTVER
jgi:hypothetical protein